MSTAIRFAHRVSVVAALAALLLTLALVTPTVSTAQSAWTNPFETPEEQQDEESPYGTWGTPQQDEDPWNTNDPWGLEERNRSYGDSDWARDFYDFEDGNSDEESSGDKGSAERVGDGVVQHAKSCTDNSDCGSGAGNGNDKICCNVNGTKECLKPDKCSRDGGTPVPLPGIVYLLLAGLGYGGYRLRDRHTA